MGNLYGKPKPTPNAPAPSTEDQLTKLEKRKTYTQARIENATTKAKECIQTNDKPGAERWLRQVTQLRSELKTIYAMITKLETLQATYQQSRMTRDVLQTTEAATVQIRSLNMDADKADIIMDSARDVIADMDDVNRVILGPLTREPDVSEELAALESEEIKVHVMPEPPLATIRPPTPPMVRELRAAIPA
jgi:DNA repair exonuclease SbcCD ATPase subunit